MLSRTAWVGKNMLSLRSVEMVEFKQMLAAFVSAFVQKPLALLLGKSYPTACNIFE